MSESEPTLAEVVRHLDRIAAQLSALANRLDNDRLLAAKTFVNRETYASDQRLYDAIHAGLRNDVTELEKARESEQAWRRQQSLILATAAAGWLVTIALAIAGFLR